MAKSKSGVQHFKARLEKGDNGLGWIVAPLPFVPRDVWKEMLRLRVQGTIQGFAFRTSLFPFREGRGGFYLLVNKAMQTGAHVGLGSTAEFTLEPDFAERPAELPEMFEVLLDDEPGLRAFYDAFSESMRREAGQWILGVKSEEAQQRRAEQMAERMLFAMEGEKQLPPIPEVAFRKRPKARIGWAKLTPLQRRQEMMAIPYYQTPEARERRVGKLCDLAESKA